MIIVDSEFSKPSVMLKSVRTYLCLGHTIKPLKFAGNLLNLVIGLGIHYVIVHFCQLKEKLDRLKSLSSIAFVALKLKCSGDHKMYEIPSADISSAVQNLMEDLESALKMNGSISQPRKNSKSKEIRIPVPWGHIAGKSWGSPDGYPVLGLHGWLDNCGTFDKLVPLLPSSFYFVTVDMPGHGFSSRLPPGMSYDFWVYFTTVRRIVNYLGWKKFSIIGHSLGAGTGALFASAYPDEVENLVLIDLTKPSDANDGILSSVNAFLNAESKGTKIAKFSYHEALERMQKATSHALSEESAKVLMVRGARQVDEGEYSFTTDTRVPCPMPNGLSNEPLFQLLMKIQCRLLYIRAINGMVFEGQVHIDRALEIYKSHCAEFKQVDVDGNHFVHLNNPEIVAAHINEFFGVTDQNNGH